MAPFPPNLKLLVPIFRRLPPVMVNATRGLNYSFPRMAWEGSKPENHITREADSHMSFNEASKDKKDGTSGAESSDAVSGKDIRKQNEKAKGDHPEAPGPVIGMNDERGGKGQ